MRTLLMMAALLAASVAFAGNDHYDPPKPPATPTTKIDVDANSHSSSNSAAVAASSSKSESNSHSNSNSTSSAKGGNANAVSVSQGGKGGDSKSNASQHQTAQGGQGGQGGEGGDSAANNEGNSLSVNNEDRLQAPSIVAPNIYPSGNCAYGWSIGFSVPGGGASGGKAKPDPACERREAARVVMALNPALALKIMCQDPAVKAVATEQDCVWTPPVVEKQSTTSCQTTGSDCATKEDLTRAFKSAISK